MANPKRSKNAKLSNAKVAKKDEFYTKLIDIENELYHYKDHFRDKTVYCNCDNPEGSNFYLYFSLNFEFFGLKKLIATHFLNDIQEGQKAYKLEIFADMNGDGKINKLDTVKTFLEGDGDFRSEECVEILKEADIIVTNPPFSLFREFIGLMDKHNKKFIVIGNQNAITYKETFGLIKDKKVWLGHNTNVVMEFKVPDSYESVNGFVKVPAISWFTNLPHKKRNEKLTLFRNYYGCESDYPKYDGFDAINIDKTAMIPFDYEGVMGVPITFLDKFNPEQFEILGAESFCDIEVRDGVFQKPNHKLENSNRLVYKRIWIKNKNPQKVMGIDNE